jgi:hypothetical protein
MSPRHFVLVALVASAAFGCATARDDSVPSTFDAGVDTGRADSSTTEDTNDTTAPGDSAPASDSSDSSAPDTTLPETTPDDTSAPEGSSDTGATDIGGDAPTALVFPRTGDTVVIKSDPFMWHAGDYVEGSRTIPLSNASKLTGTWMIKNGLAVSPCGFPYPIYTGGMTVEVFVNDTKIGTLSLDSTSGDSIPVIFTFPSIAGPTYKLKYREVKDVDGSCGQIELKMDLSTLTLE